MKKTRSNTFGKDFEIVRPAYDLGKFFITNGTYPAKIVDVNAETCPSKYPGGDDWILVTLVNKVQTDKGDITKFFEVPMSWNPNSKWMQLLDELGLTVDEGETFKSAFLNGLSVVVEVENVERGGKRYSNIVMIKKQPGVVSTSSMKRPARPTQSPRTVPKGGAEALFEGDNQERS